MDANLLPAIAALEQLLWDFGLKPSVLEIKAADNKAELHCIIAKGHSRRVIETVFDHNDYRPKYEIIRGRFAENFPGVEVKYLI